MNENDEKVLGKVLDFINAGVKLGMSREFLIDQLQMSYDGLGRK